MAWAYPHEFHDGTGEVASGVQVNDNFAKAREKIEALEAATAPSVYFETGGQGGGGLIANSSQTVTTPANTLVSWRARIHGEASGGTEGGVVVKIVRDGVVVKEHVYRVCNNGAFGTSVEVIEFVQAAAGAHAWQVIVTNFGASFAATVDSGMLTFAV